MSIEEVNCLKPKPTSVTGENPALLVHSVSSSGAVDTYTHKGQAPFPFPRSLSQPIRGYAPYSWMQSSMNRMPTLTTNTVVVPSRGHSDPISSPTAVHKHDAFGHFKAILKRRKSRMPPNPKRTPLIELKIIELRVQYMESYLTGAEATKRNLCNQLISQDAPINTKYKELDLEALLQKNMVHFKIPGLVQALSIQEKYASNLMKPSKPKFWRTVKFTSSLWKTYLESIRGSTDILKQMGYTKELQDGLSFPDDILNPDVERVKELAADLYLAKIETDDLVDNRHPYYVIEKITPIQTTKIKRHHTTDEIELSTSEESDAEFQDAKDGFSSDEETQTLSRVTLPQKGSTDAKSCHLCGSNVTSWYCNDCEQDFCEDCVITFHKHPTRKEHKYQRKSNETFKGITSLVSTEPRKFQNVAPAHPVLPIRHQDDTNKVKKPVPKPRTKRIPSKPNSVPSPVEVVQPPSYPRILSPAHFDKKMIRTGPVILEKAPQQPSGQGSEREILRPPAEVKDYKPVNEPLKVLLLPRDEENAYQSLKDHDLHVYETLDNESKDPTPPPLPPRRKTLEKTKVVVRKGATTCPHCFCLNAPESETCVACGTPLREQSSSPEARRRHEEQRVIHDPWVSTTSQPPEVEMMQRNTTPLPKDMENPLYFAPSAATTGVVTEKASGVRIATQDFTSKPAELQWECTYCTLLNPMNKRICALCAKTKTDDARVVKPDPAPSDNTIMVTPEPVQSYSAKMVTPDPVPSSSAKMVKTEPMSMAAKLQEEELKRLHRPTFNRTPSALVQSLQREEEQVIMRKKPEDIKSTDTEFFYAQLLSCPSPPTYTLPFPSFTKGDNQEAFRLPKEMDQTRRERVIFDMEIKEARETGRDFVKKMKQAESLGFLPEELSIAYTLSIEDPQGPIHWLQTKWFDLIHQVMIRFTDASKKEDIGNVSPEEARQALVERTGVVEDAVDLCVEQRKNKLKEVMESGFYPKTHCITTLDKNDGDVIKSIQELQIVSFQPMLQRIKDSCLTDEADGYEQWQQRPNHDRQLSTSPDEELFEAMVSNKEIDQDRRIRVMLAEKKFISWGRACTAVRLIDMEFPVYDSIEAAKANGDLKRSLEFLQRPCILCAEEKSENQMVTMLNCQCRFCRDCVSVYFTLVIQEHNIMRLVCPQCSEPENLDDDVLATEYFNNLDIMMRGIIDKETHDLFQRKLRDRTLMKEPNFRWCSHCSSGFINERPDVIKMACPNCRKYTCFNCKKQWEDQHEGISCEQFAAWKEANDPELQANGLAAHLKQNGIECPNCKFRYDLAKGGCMHFKCNQCDHEFCSGCYQPFRQGNHCNLSANCARKGLHAHHPRDCLFYLRDRDSDELKKLLDDHKIEYNTEPPKVAGAVNQGFQEEEGAAAPAGRCKVMEQRETPDGLQDDECGKETPPGFAGLCSLHFREYLVERINASLIDPVGMYDVKDLEAVIKRNDKEPPARKAREKDPAYRERLVQFVKTHLALPKMPPRRRVLNNEEPVAEEQVQLILNEEEHDGPGGGMDAHYNVLAEDIDGESNDGYDSYDGNDGYDFDSDGADFDGIGLDPDDDGDIFG